MLMAHGSSTSTHMCVCVHLFRSETSRTLRTQQTRTHAACLYIVFIWVCVSVVRWASSKVRMFVCCVLCCAHGTTSVHVQLRVFGERCDAMRPTVVASLQLKQRNAVFVD